MLRTARRSASGAMLVIVSLALGPVGAGAVTSQLGGDTCGDESGEACDGCADDASDGAVQLRDHAPPRCPPFCDHCAACDDCACCGLGAIAVSQPLIVVRAASPTVVCTLGASAPAPSGERTGVFRPPRA